MKVLMIGGSGIISSEISQKLLDDGHEVFMINRGKRKTLLDKRANLILGDVRNESVEEIYEKIKENTYDVVIDFISFQVDQLKKTMKYIDGLYSQFVFISSATVYQKTDEIITEESAIGNNQWQYAADKIECEEFLAEYFKEKEEFYTVVRPYVTYGKTRFPFAMLPTDQWSLAHRLLSGKPIAVWNDGQAVCTLTHSKEFAIGFIGLMDNPKAKNEVFHITSDFQYTWEEVLKITAKALGVEAKIVNIPEEFIEKKLPQYVYEVKGDKGRNMRFSSKKLKEAVPNFDCQIDFATGIKETVDYYDNNPEQKVVNQSWDGDMDWLIDQFYKENKKENPYKKDLCYAKSTKNAKDCLKYMKHRYTLLRLI